MLAINEISNSNDPDNHLYIENEKQIFLADVISGLSQFNKQIPSKYFYDEAGSILFNRITRHPDYYLTQCEIEILSNNYDYFAKLITQQAFNIVELGPGEGIKTQRFLQVFLQHNLSFTYIPIDISFKYLSNLKTLLQTELPNINMSAVQGDYLNGLKWLVNKSQNQNLILFLGSSIGNYSLEHAEKFFRDLRHIINNNDYVLIGFDLRKDIPTLIKSYDDNEGITREFNLNLLKRINQELGGNFNIDNFYHYATYNVYSGAMESYLVSLKEHEVLITEANKTFKLNPFEAIHVEYSYKYIPSQISSLAKKTGFKMIKNFTDSRHYFIDSLWQVVK